MIAELRKILRSLARARRFTVAAVVCIALAVGASTAIFSAVATTLLFPGATPEVGRLVVVRDELPKLKLPDSPVSPPEVFDLSSRRDLFSTGAGFDLRDYVVTDAGTSSRYRGARTLGDLFRVFRVRPYLGRFYTAEASRAGQHLVAVLSYAFWQDRFGGDPSIVGRPLRMNDRTYTIVGVLPPGFAYPRAAQVFTPFPIDSAFEQLRVSQSITAVFRLADGVTADAARAALAGEAATWRDRYPQAPYAAWGHRLSLTSLVAFDAGQLRPTLLVLLGAVALLFLIGCANVACLQLVRATARARDLSVQAALGATRGRIVRRLLSESAAVALLGGLGGVVLGWALTRILARFAPPDQLALKGLTVSGPVLGATVCLMAVAALLCGALPAANASRVNLRETLHETTRGGTGGRARHRVFGAIVATQVALSLVLLLTSGVMLRSLGQLLQVDPGFRPEHLVAGAVSLPFARYAPPSAAASFYDQVLERLRATPGLSAASVVSELPLASGTAPNSSPFTIVGRDTAGQGQPPHANIIAVGSDYFRVMGIPLLRGRTFGAADDVRPTPGSVARLSVVIDDELARRYFPGADPIGHEIHQGPPATIVGVVGSVRQQTLGELPGPTVYYNYRQWWTKNYTVVARGPLPETVELRALRAAITGTDPQVPVFDLASVSDVVGRSLSTRRFGAIVLALFAFVALSLAAVGIFGVLSYVVAGRSREFGIRVVLGAGPPDVIRLVLRTGGLVAALGLLGGALAFGVFGRVLASQVYGIGPRDPLTLFTATGVLAAVALAACWLPARRAARADPAATLRAE